MLVDTSVWSLALRKHGPTLHPATDKLAQLLRDGEDLFLTGTILQEVLQAFRAESTFRRMVQQFEPFPLLPVDRSDSIAAARLFRLCAQKGAGASTVDCQIAVLAIRHRCALLSTDKDFERMARYCDLTLA